MSADNDMQIDADVEIGDVTGWIVTFWDCTCGETNQVEGDANGDSVECSNCSAVGRIVL